MSNTEVFARAVEQRHNYARQWKARTGGKVIGYFCCYLPEELVYAAGALPVRILSSQRLQEQGGTLIPTFFCSFCRDCLAEGLSGNYDYLDGVVMAHTCRQIAQAYESWIRHIPHSFHYYFPFPALTENAPLKPWVVAEMEEFKESLEGFTGRAVPQQALQKAVDVYNRNRRLLGDMYALRKRRLPAVSGTLAFEMVLSSMLCDKAEHNAWLEELLAGPPPAPGDYQPRLMLVGGESHNPELVRLIEAQGARVVVDDLCMGTRYFWGLVPEEGNLLQGLATRYLQKPGCPVKDITNSGYHHRQGHILQLAREYSVEGAVLVYQKFCDPQELDIPFLKRTFESGGIPTCIVEMDSTLARGQIQTRVQAFLETIDMGVA